jgi:Flp pilus assembly protein TadG
MKAPFQTVDVRFQRGVAAVEFAVILPVLLGVLAFCLFFGRVCWHYTTAEKAAHDASRYLSAVPSIEWRTPARAANVVLVARAIAEQEVAGLNPGPYAPVITVACDAITCDGFSTPANIAVTVRLAMFDERFYNFTSDTLGDAPLTLTASVSMRYVGK